MQELDSYPRPVTPLEFERLAAVFSGPFTVSLLIDEQGVVNEVDVAGPATAHRLNEELRAMLAAARFVPARRNGHTVRSRIVLSVDAGRAY